MRSPERYFSTAILSKRNLFACIIALIVLISPGAADPWEVTRLSPQEDVWDEVAISGDRLVARASLPTEGIVLCSLSTGECQYLDRETEGFENITPRERYSPGPPDISGNYAVWLRTPGDEPENFTTGRGRVVLADLVNGTQQVIDEGHRYDGRVRIAGDRVCWMEREHAGAAVTSTLRVYGIREGRAWSVKTFNGSAVLGNIEGDRAIYMNPEQKNAVVALNITDGSEVVLSGPGRNPDDFSISGVCVLWAKKDINGRFSKKPGALQKISTDSLLSLISLPDGGIIDLAAASLSGEGRGPGDFVMNGADLGSAAIEGDRAAWVLREYAGQNRSSAIVVRRISDGAESRIIRNGTVRALTIADGRLVWQESAGQVYLAVPTASPDDPFCKMAMRG
ncbi:hypothetical protein RJ40_02110 [Methanofollis aquaemaris]|uniref:Uncharacterized protein n=1 Tax=Methanofollis aquaemaris TaxID=126734 RepID=A0A8A3S1T7_9EURY|nr:hypothetical protein [Methanofollis aquaemaris]QSZ66377.1 hypothetical protein RJ40_02110 [Methanofollis aquaemaris]